MNEKEYSLFSACSYDSFRTIAGSFCSTFAWISVFLNKGKRVFNFFKFINVRSIDIIIRCMIWSSTTTFWRFSFHLKTILFSVCYLVLSKKKESIFNVFRYIVKKIVGIPVGWIENVLLREFSMRLRIKVKLAKKKRIKIDSQSMWKISYRIIFWIWMKSFM